MSELIDRQSFIEQERKLYCEDCDRRKGTKKGKPNVICYEIGEAPCRACWLDDALGDLEDFPTASPWHRVEEPPKEEGRYWCAKKFAGHWIFTAAWYWNNVSDYTGVPVGEEDKADGFVFGEDVVYPDYWMPIEPPKEDA